MHDVSGGCMKRMAGRGEEPTSPSVSPLTTLTMASTLPSPVICTAVRTANVMLSRIWACCRTTHRERRRQAVFSSSRASWGRLYISHPYSVPGLDCYKWFENRRTLRTPVTVTGVNSARCPCQLDMATCHKA